MGRQACRHPPLDLHWSFAPSRRLRQTQFIHTRTQRVRSCCIPFGIGWSVFIWNRSFELGHSSSPPHGGGEGGIDSGGGGVERVSGDGAGAVVSGSDREV